MKKSAAKQKGSRAGRSKASTSVNAPIRRKAQVQQSNDEHIDQDYPGFPDPPSNEKTIRNGSAGAFEATEGTRDDEDSDEDNDDLAMGH
jgi:hypothetical protein